MTKEEVTNEFVLRLLKTVDTCDKVIHAAYEKRAQTLTELNEWLVEAYKEASKEE